MIFTILFTFFSSSASFLGCWGDPPGRHGGRPFSFFPLRFIPPCSFLLFPHLSPPLPLPFFPLPFLFFDPPCAPFGSHVPPWFLCVLPSFFPPCPFHFPILALFLSHPCPTLCSPPFVHFWPISAPCFPAFYFPFSRLFLLTLRFAFLPKP